VIIYFKKNSN